MKQADLQERINTYQGGIARIRNRMEGYFLVGAIEEIALRDGDVVAKFSWVTKYEGYPGESHWVLDSRLDYAGPEIYHIQYMGHGRTRLHSTKVHEDVLLYPRGAIKIRGPTDTKKLNTFLGRRFVEQAYHLLYLIEKSVLVSTL